MRAIIVSLWALCVAFSVIEASHAQDSIIVEGHPSIPTLIVPKAEGRKAIDRFLARGLISEFSDIDFHARAESDLAKIHFLRTTEVDGIVIGEGISETGESFFYFIKAVHYDWVQRKISHHLELRTTGLELLVTEKSWQSLIARDSPRFQRSLDSLNGDDFFTIVLDVVI